MLLMIRGSTNNIIGIRTALFLFTKSHQNLYWSTDSTEIYPEKINY